MPEENDLGKMVVNNCEPLYLSKPFMHDGHTAEKANGTITYVKYNNSIYGITCAHIYYEQLNDKWLTVFGTNRVIYQFGHYDVTGYVSDFRVLRKNRNDTEQPDIAIIKLAEPFPSIHLSAKDKEPIDLDSWTAPDWSSLKMCMACGFPTEHKIETTVHVSAKLVQVTAELMGRLTPLRSSFLLASSLPEGNNVFFSGMSGGPVYCDGENDNQPTLIGIVFEGSPGSSFQWNNRGEDSFLTTGDIQIRASVLTPAIFKDWLMQLNYI